MGAARRVATNLTARADVVRAAKDLGLNLSEVFEAAVIEAIRRKRGEAWLAENLEAIGSYDEKAVRRIDDERIASRARDLQGDEAEHRGEAGDVRARDLSRQRVLRHG